MKPDVDVCDIDKLVKNAEEEKIKTAIHYAVFRIQEAMYETESMEATHAQNGSNIMYFVGRQSGLNEALCRIYVTLKECLQEA